jgi:hypothetical protein
LIGQRQLVAVLLEHLVDRRHRVERAREADESRELIDRLTQLERGHADAQGGGRMGSQLRQGLHRGPYRDGDELPGPVVELADCEHVPEDQAPEDLAQFGIWLRR